MYRRVTNRHTVPDDYSTLCRSVWLPRPSQDKTDHAAADLGRRLELEPSMGSKIVNGTRQLTTAHIRRLARHFALPADYFLEV